jgi:hypothetical protein
MLVNDLVGVSLRTATFQALSPDEGEFVTGFEMTFGSLSQPCSFMVDGYSFLWTAELIPSP